MSGPSPETRPGPAAPAPGRLPVFLDRRSYRQRRLRDALRLMPVLGALLWLVPLLWPKGAEPVAASAALIYLFAVWAGLIVLSALLARRVRPEVWGGRSSGEAEDPAP